MNGKLIELIGKLPVVLKNGEFAPQHSHGFEANLIYKENTKKIYLATRLGNIVEKYSLNGELISTFLGPDSFFPEYKIVPAGSSYTMTYNKKSRFGYLDIRYNKNLDRLFLLYSGKSQNNTKSRPSLGNFVYVLDHKDKIIEKIILDNNIDQMIISDDGSTIFGASETDILKFDYNESSKGK